MLLDDQLAQYEAIARAACTGLADRITSREIGLQSPVHGSTWLDIAILEAESDGDPRARAEAIVTTTISVSVRQTSASQGSRLERWIDGLAYARILHAAGLEGLYARIQSGQINQVASDISGTLVVYSQRTVRAVLANYQIRRQDVLGLTVRTDGGATTFEGADAGRARSAFPGRAISWISPGIALAPVSGAIVYAGATAGDAIEVLDDDGLVIESLAPPTLPTGTVTTVAVLGVGDYVARLGDTVTDQPLQVTERPF